MGPPPAHLGGFAFFSEVVGAEGSGPHGPAWQVLSVELSELPLFIEGLLSARSGVLVLAVNTHMPIESQWARQQAE